MITIFLFHRIETLNRMIQLYMKNSLGASLSWIVVLAILFIPHSKTYCAQPITWQGITYDDETVAELITVIVSTSPVQSIPSTTHLYPALESLCRIPAFALCKKIIVFDGIRPGQEERYTISYGKYKQNVLELTKTDSYFSNTELVYCPKWVHLTGAIHEAMKHVKTPFLYIHQHDLQITQEFDLNGLIATMVANPAIRCVMLGGGNNASSQGYHGPVDQKISGEHFVPLFRCFGWSDQAQITTVDYYENVVFPQCRANKGAFMEQTMLHRLRYDVQELGTEIAHPIYACYLYGGPFDGSYIKHTDARNN